MKRALPVLLIGLAGCASSHEAARDLRQALQTTLDTSTTEHSATQAVTTTVQAPGETITLRFAAPGPEERRSAANPGPVPGQTRSAPFRPGSKARAGAPNSFSLPDAWGELPPHGVLLEAVIQKTGGATSTTQANSSADMHARATGTTTGKLDEHATEKSTSKPFGIFALLSACWPALALAALVAAARVAWKLRRTVP
jgi:hypothetical protein